MFPGKFANYKKVQSFKKQQTQKELPYDPTVPLLGIHTQKCKSRDLIRYLYIQVHSSVIHNSQKVEATQVPTNGRMDRQNEIYICITEYHSALKSKFGHMLQHG